MARGWETKRLEQPGTEVRAAENVCQSFMQPRLSFEDSRARQVVQPGKLVGQFASLVVVVARYGVDPLTSNPPTGLERSGRIQNESLGQS
jgi:hypothetical protein